MKKIIVLVALLLSGCGGGSQATNPMPVAQAPVAPVPVAAPHTAVVFIGDSITVTWTLPASYINAGISGQSSFQMLDRFQSDVLDKHPLIVHILAGTNDIAGGSTTTSQIQRMVELAQANEECVILGTLPPRIDGRVSAEQIAQFNADLKILAASFGVRVADYHSVLVLPDGSFDASLFADLVHPNDAGHAKMWAVVEPLIHQCGG